MKEKINSNSCICWGIIGCGDVMEQKSGPAYNKVSGSKLIAVMGRDKSKIKDYAKRHGVPKYYTNADNLIHDNEVDAVYIATPPDSHKEYALKVAEAEKPCCIEKPMAPRYADCLVIVDHFKKKELPLFVAYYRRTLPRFNKIKNWLDNGDIGEPRHISWIYSCPASEQDLSKEYNWRTDTNIATGGYFDDLASHGLDLFNFLLGDICEVTGFRTNQQDLYTADDSVSAIWKHPSNITGSGSWNFGSFLYQDRVQILGSEGNIDFSIFSHRPIILENKKILEEVNIEHPENIQFFHVESMVAHLRGDTIHPSLGDSGAHTSWVMDKIMGLN